MRRIIIATLSSFFYIGYLPLIPGTFGSAAGLFIFFLLRNNQLILILCALIITAIGFICCGRAEEVFKKKDSKNIVIDEVSGMMLSLLFLPFEFKVWILAFFIFRLLDTLKPYPADRIQDMKGSLGVMGDDIVAAIYTNIILQAVLKAQPLLLLHR
jgi:phosphatidylglycerophosphatase A